MIIHYSNQSCFIIICQTLQSNETKLGLESWYVDFISLYFGLFCFYHVLMLTTFKQTTCIW